MDFIEAADWRALPAEQWRWPNFRPAEFACRGAPGRGSIRIAAPLLDKLQALRIAMGRPMVVTSGYRSAGYNATLPGAAPNSTHVQGLAADISMGNFLGDEVLFIHQGRLVERGPVDRFLKQPASAEAAAFVKGELPWI